MKSIESGVAALPDLQLRLDRVLARRERHVTIDAAFTSSDSEIAFTLAIVIDVDGLIARTDLYPPGDPGAAAEPRVHARPLTEKLCNDWADVFNRRHQPEKVNEALRKAQGYVAAARPQPRQATQSR